MDSKEGRKEGRKELLRFDYLTHTPEIPQSQRNTITRALSPNLLNPLSRRQNRGIYNGNLAFSAEFGHEGAPARALDLFPQDGCFEEREGEFGQEVLEQGGFLGTGERAGF